MMNAGVPGWGSPAPLIRRRHDVTRGPDRDEPAAGGGDDDEAGAEAWTPVERALLDAALEFYGAAQGVIKYSAHGRPQVRRDAAGFDAVRRTMGRLEERVLAAHAAGMTSHRIAEIARIERDIVALILERREAAPSPAED
jgi:hypothetical protein